MDWLRSQPVLMQAFWQGFYMGVYYCRLSCCVFFKHISRRLLDIMMGFAAGVMIAASFWSLLAPSIEYAQGSYGKVSWLPAAIGFLVGGFFLRLIDAIVPHLHLSKDISEAEGISGKAQKNYLRQLCFSWLLLSIIFQKVWQLELPLALWLPILVQRPL